MFGFLTLYQTLTRTGKLFLERLLERRLKEGKEDANRLNERKGVTSVPRPAGPLIWLHGASVGESLSTLILIDALEKLYPGIRFLVTTGTVTSAGMMAKRLPPSAIHQFIPIDSPDWVQSFLDHWKPDAALWMESELWPNMILEAHKRGVPIALINARLSKKSYARWKLVKPMIREVLESFSVILTQTAVDEEYYRDLGAKNVATTGNLKYSAAPLPFDANALAQLQGVIGSRPCWVYASCHEGEETLAARVHQQLADQVNGLLTILVPRHIDRRARIADICNAAGLKYTLRGDAKTPPADNDDIYIADTMGELGLFYSLAPIAMIGRSFSDDGGGGHNPVEAAQLNCAVLTGPNVQYQQEMFDDMFDEGAAIQAKTEEQLYTILSNFFSDQEKLATFQERSASFAAEKSRVIDHVMAHLSPHLRGLEKKDAA